MKIELELTDKQFNALTNGIEAYSRIINGQFDTLYYEFYGRIEGNAEQFNSKLKELRKIVFPELSDNENYGIGNNETSEKTKILYEIYKMLNYEKYKLDKRTDYTVDSSKPIKVSKEPLPKVKISV